MLPFLAAVRVFPRPRWGGRDPGVRKVFQLMLPAIFGSSVAQISILLDTLIASFLVTGSISWLYFSDRLMEFPLGVFGIAVATVILPILSRLHAAGSADTFAATLDWALRLVVLIAAPAAVGLFVLAGPALATIFYGGRFSASDVDLAGMSLMAYAFGLLGFTLVKVLVPGYFARQDTRTPVKVGLIALSVNMVLNIAIVVPWVQGGYTGPHTGLAIATSVGAFVNAGLLYRGLRNAGVLRPSPGWSKFLLRVAVASAVMAVLINYYLPALDVWLETSVATRCGWLATAVAGGALAYAGVLFAVGVRPSELRVNTIRRSL
jgi:putative peptidoglycan lipid II flippase